MPEDYYLDKQQREYLLKDLATLLEHIHDLDNVLTRQTRYHGQGRNSAETPLPFSVKASNLQHELAAALPGICETLGYITHLTSNLATPLAARKLHDCGSLSGRVKASRRHCGVGASHRPHRRQAEVPRLYRSLPGVW